MDRGLLTKIEELLYSGDVTVGMIRRQALRAVLSARDLKRGGGKILPRSETKKLCADVILLTAYAAYVFDFDVKERLFVRFLDYMAKQPWYITERIEKNILLRVANLAEMVVRNRNDFVSLSIDSIKNEINILCIRYELTYEECVEHAYGMIKEEIDRQQERKTQWQEKNL